MEPLISIVMPAFNSENYIEKAIDSVLKQSFKRFQLIIVDDGSTDKTSEIIKSFNDERICYYYQENSGIAGAYKSAFQLIAGDYITFLDSDDMLDENALKTISDNLAQYKCDILQYGISYYDENWNYTRNIVFDCCEKTNHEIIVCEYLKGIISGRDRPNLGIRTYKKELFDGFSFPVGSLGIDEILNLYAMCRCKHIAYINDALYMCQRRMTSVSRIKADSNKAKKQIESFEIMTDIINQYAPSFIELHYIRMLRYYAKYSKIILSLDNFEHHRSLVKDYYQSAKSQRSYLVLSVKIRILMMVFCPKALYSLSILKRID